MRKIHLYSSALLLIALLAARSFAAPAAHYQEGDVIGESEIRADTTTAIFEASTRSRFGHIAILFQSPKGEWEIYEATPPFARVTPLNQFMARNHGAFAAIRRKIPLSSTELAAIKKTANQLVTQKTPYNFTFVNNPGSLYCSEFVAKVYAAANIQVGRFQTVSELNTQAFRGIFWKILTRTQRMPLDEEVITPVSIMKTPGWIKVGGPLDPHGTYTDAQLLEQWKKEDLLPVINSVLRIPEATLTQFAQP